MSLHRKPGKHTLRFAVTVPLTAVVLLVATGGAFALWSSNASGSGEAEARSAVAVTVAAASGSATIYPGGPAGAVNFTLNNTNPYPVKFIAMTPGAVTSSNQAACPASNLTAAPASGLNLPVAAGATTATQTIASVVSLAAAAPDGCQGVTFTVAMTLTGSQV